MVTEVRMGVGGQLLTGSDEENLPAGRDVLS